jgi:uncharacterized membrane protein YozB (DUF420 family)
MTVKRASDGGLQPQRTSLSWSRTIFVLLINVLVVIRVGYSDQNTAVLYAGIILAVLTFVFYITYVYRTAGFEFEGELTTQSAIWVKRLLSAILCIAALSIFLSSMTNLIQNYIL